MTGAEQATKQPGKGVVVRDVREQPKPVNRDLVETLRNIGASARTVTYAEREAAKRGL